MVNCASMHVLVFLFYCTSKKFYSTLLNVALTVESVSAMFCGCLYRGWDRIDNVYKGVCIWKRGLNSKHRRFFVNVFYGWSTKVELFT